MTQERSNMVDLPAACATWLIVASASLTCAHTISVCIPPLLGLAKLKAMIAFDLCVPHPCFCWAGAARSGRQWRVIRGCIARSKRELWEGRGSLFGGRFSWKTSSALQVFKQNGLADMPFPLAIHLGISNAVSPGPPATWQG